MLCKNNKFNEYYLGDLPGTLQYNKEQKYIIDSVNDCEYNELESGGFVFCSHSKENLNRMLNKLQIVKKQKEKERGGRRSCLLIYYICKDNIS